MATWHSYLTDLKHLTTHQHFLVLFVYLNSLYYHGVWIQPEAPMKPHLWAIKASGGAYPSPEVLWGLVLWAGWEWRKANLAGQSISVFDTFHIKPAFYRLMFVFICVCGVCVCFYGCVHMDIWGHIHVYTHGSQGLMSGVFLLTLHLGFWDRVSLWP